MNGLPVAVAFPQTSRELALKIVAECFKGVPAYPHFDEDHAIALIDAWVWAREAKARRTTLAEVLDRWDKEGVEAGDIWDWLLDESIPATAREQLEEKVK